MLCKCFVFTVVITSSFLQFLCETQFLTLEDTFSSQCGSIYIHLKFNFNVYITNLRKTKNLIKQQVIKILLVNETGRTRPSNQIFFFENLDLTALFCLACQI